MATTPFAFPRADRMDAVQSSPIRDILNIIKRGDVISFAGGIPDATLFEAEDLRASYDWVMTHQASRALQYASTPGEPEIREQAARLVTNGGLTTDPEQIQMTTGSQEGLYLIGQALLGPGSVVLVESPTYLAAIQAFTLAGATLVQVESDDEGVIIEDLERKIAEHNPCLIYLIPNFQNPSGRTMGYERRKAVAEVLVRTGVALAEDDPYGQLRYEGEFVPPIASFPGMSAQSLVLGSLSKVVAPGMRVAWLRGEGEVLRDIEVIKQAVALQCPVVDQLAAARYLDHYDLDAHLDRVIAAYRERRDAMIEAMCEILGPEASINSPVGGMFCWARLGHGIDTEPLLQSAVDHGVAFVPGRSFFAEEPDRSTMRLSYVTNSPETIREGVRRLGEALREAGYPVGSAVAAV